MARTQSAAIATAKKWVGRAYPAGWCQKWVVTEIFQSGGVGDWDGDRAADAEDGWKAAKRRVATTNAASVPAGYPIYFLGGGSDHGHAAVSAGNGDMYSTDRPYTGRIGKVPIKSVERPWGVKFAGYVITDGNGNTFTDPKPVAYVKPVSKGPAFKVATYNLAMYNRRGKDTYLTRRVDIVRNVTNATPDILFVQEAGYEELKWWDAEFATLGLFRAKGGSDGRYIYYRKSLFTLQASGVFELHPEYDNDDKQAAWAVLRIDGIDYFVSSFHLESADGAAADAIRPKQMESLFDQAAVECVPRKIPLHRRIFAGDTNSQTLVKNHMWQAHRFVTASKNATTVINSVFATFNNWIAKLRGAHVDYIFVHYDRPVERWSQITSTASDHNLVFATIGKK